jgi:hypothetical protein
MTKLRVSYSVMVFMFALSILFSVIIWVIANIFFEITLVQLFFIELMLLISRKLYMFISRKVLSE